MWGLRHIPNQGIYNFYLIPLHATYFANPSVDGLTLMRFAHKNGSHETVKDSNTSHDRALNPKPQTKSKRVEAVRLGFERLLCFNKKP